jgi:uncharacterized membrane protein YidH (DUF202 family)
MNPNTLNLVGLVLNLVGTIIAAFSATQYFLAVHAGLSMLETTLNAYLDNDKFIPSFRNADKMRNKTLKTSGAWTLIGVVLIAIGFALKVAAIFVVAP